MTMLSFRVDDADAVAVQSWARRLEVDRSELLREALRHHLVRLASERDSEAWIRQPLTTNERSLDAISVWGPAEDWADWADADPRSAG